MVDYEDMDGMKVEVGLSRGHSKPPSSRCLPATLRYFKRRCNVRTHQLEIVQAMFQRSLQRLEPNAASYQVQLFRAGWQQVLLQFAAINSLAEITRLPAFFGVACQFTNAPMQELELPSFFQDSRRMRLGCKGQLVGNLGTER